MVGELIPVPVFFSDFLRRKRRPPRPDELTLEERKQLMECCRDPSHSDSLRAAMRHSLGLTPVQQ